MGLGSDLRVWLRKGPVGRMDSHATAMRLVLGPMDGADDGGDR